jgi:hypothetical protein
MFYLDHHIEAEAWAAPDSDHPDVQRKHETKVTLRLSNSDEISLTGSIEANDRFRSIHFAAVDGLSVLQSLTKAPRFEVYVGGFAYGVLPADPRGTLGRALSDCLAAAHNNPATATSR